MGAHWNYRVIRSRVGETHSLAIHTVHYEDGKPTWCSEKASVFAAHDDIKDDGLVGLRGSLESAWVGCTYPILEMSVFDEPTDPEEGK